MNWLLDHDVQIKVTYIVFARYVQGEEVSLTSSKDAYNIRIYTMGTNLFFVTTDHGDVTAYKTLPHSVSHLYLYIVSIATHISRYTPGNSNRRKEREC